MSRRADRYPQYIAATGHHREEGDCEGRSEKRGVDHGGNSQKLGQLVSVAERRKGMLRFGKMRDVRSRKEE